MENRFHELIRHVLYLHDDLDNDDKSKLAVFLAYQALRLGFYLYRKDELGVDEKKFYLNRSFEDLKEALSEDTK